MKNKVVILAMAVAVAVSLSGCESWKRDMKTIKSDFSGGLERTVTLYSNTGEVIKEWTGKFDISNSENEIFFDIDGKRVIIHGGIVVSEETK